jgi:GWxTD domain-containing protein
MSLAGRQGLILICFFAMVGAVSAGRRAPKPEAQELFERGQTFYRNGQLDSAITVLQRATLADRRYAEAWNALALAYMDLGTLQGRIKATRALERALRLDWHNPEYNYNMGVLHLKKGMPSAAARFFKKILKRNPGHARATYQLGRIAEEQMLRYKDMISPQEEGVIFYLTEYAEKDRLKAENYYRRAIALDPNLSDAYYRLALIQYEVRNLDDMIELLQRALRAAPDTAFQRRKDYYLFLGLAYHRSGRANEALAAFEQARSLMGREELALFDSVEVIMTPKQAQLALAAPVGERLRLRQQFWKQRDPLFLTALNERLLEHYARIAYANLRFSFPEKGIVGWKTDRGQTLIRFGEPEVLFRTRPSIEVTFGAGNPIRSSKEYWGYPGFEIVFDDEYLSGNYRFKRGFYPEEDYKYQYEELIEKRPDFYRHDYGGERFEVPRVVASFRGDKGKTRLEIFYGVPGHEIALRKEGRLSTVRLRRGVFFFDLGWNEILRDVEYRQLVLAEEIPEGEPLYLIDREQMQLPAGTYNFALELVDEDSKNVGVERDLLKVRSFASDSLQLSDILLASTIQADSVRPVYDLGGTDVVPNLFGTFAVDQPVYVYFEIYNLTLTEGGLTRYRIEHLVRSAERPEGIVSRLVSGITSLLGRQPRGPEEIATSYEYVGEESTASHYNSIQLGNARSGLYELVVRVTDLVSGAHTEGRSTFRLVEPVVVR